MQPPAPIHYEVAIAGGGPAGCAAAIKLARAGHRVLLVDAAPVGSFRIGEGLPPTARSLLNELGVLTQFLADGHRTSFGNVSHWGSDQAHMSDFLLQIQGHGFQLDRVRFDAMLKQAAQTAGVNVVTAQRLSLLETGSGTLSRLELQIGQGNIGNHTNSTRHANSKISADFLIDATGRSANLARKLGSKRQPFDQLIAFHALLQPAPTHHQHDPNTPPDRDGRTYIEAVENGWWYSVLLPCGPRLVVFLSDADLIDKSIYLSGTGFFQQLMNTRCISQLCQQHRYQISRPPLGADASSSCLQQIVGPNWLATGDAALAFDPLSSQGIASAMYSGMAAARAVQAYLQAPAPAHPALAHYAAHLNQIYQRYLEHRQRYYADEQRWHHLPFWQRRHPSQANK